MRTNNASFRRFALALTLFGAAASTAAAAVTTMFSGRIRAGATNVHAVQVGSNDNWLTVEGDGDTDLDCWIYDSNGNLVDSDTDDTDYCVLSTPGVGRHRLVIKNLGIVYNEYEVQQLRRLR